MSNLHCYFTNAQLCSVTLLPVFNLKNMFHFVYMCLAFMFINCGNIYKQIADDGCVIM